jgi:uncharacterized lipoprotein NlpE involved in copper resistance
MEEKEMSKKLRKMAKVVLMGAMMTMMLVGCGASGQSKVQKPNGLYYASNNYETTLNFSSNKVVVTEGNTSTLSYTIDKDGSMVIDPDGEEIDATYDAENDMVTIYHTKYIKRN